jgi:hypothetical protein
MKLRQRPGYHFLYHPASLRLDLPFARAQRGVALLWRPLRVRKSISGGLDGSAQNLLLDK